MRISTKDPAEMSAAQINKELDRLDEIDRRLGEEMIAADRGYERPSEYLRMMDPLSMKLRRVSDRHSKLRAEIRARYGPGAPSRLPRGYGPLKRGRFHNPATWDYDDLRDSDGKSYMLHFLPYLETPDGEKVEVVIGYRPHYRYGSWQEFFRTLSEARERMEFLISSGAVEQIELGKAVPEAGRWVTTLVDEWRA